MHLADGVATFYYTVQAHWKNLPVATFLQNTKYVALCTFQDSFKVKDPVRGTLKVLNMATFYFVGVCEYHRSSQLKCPVSGAKSLMLHFKIMNSYTNP